MTFFLRLLRFLFPNRLRRLDSIPLKKQKENESDGRVSQLPGKKNDREKNTKKTETRIITHLTRDTMKKNGGNNGWLFSTLHSCIELKKNVKKERKQREGGLDAVSEGRTTTVQVKRGEEARWAGVRWRCRLCSERNETKYEEKVLYTRSLDGMGE